MSENLMNSQHKAHTQASRDGHEATFGKKCHWHGCRPAIGIICIDSMRGHRRGDWYPEGDWVWVCQECHSELTQKVS